MNEKAREIIARDRFCVHPGKVVCAGQPCGKCLNDADQILSVLSAAGYTVVPVEPGEELLARASREFGDMQDDLPTMGWIRRAYKAVLTAAQDHTPSK